MPNDLPPLNRPADGRTAEIVDSIRPISRRIQSLLIWRALGYGIAVGGGLAILVAALDLFRLILGEWWMIGAAIGVPCLVAIGIAILKRPDEIAVVRSVDRRAGLRDRLTTALEDEESEFGELIRTDAKVQVSDVRAAELYPYRVTRWHTGGVVALALGCALFVVSTNPSLLQRGASSEEIAAAKKTAEKIERVALAELDPKADSSDEVKRLAREALRLKKELERARLNPEEALEKAQKIVQEAQKLAEEHAEKALENIESAEDAFQKLQKDALEQKGLKNVDMEAMPTSQSDAMQKVQAAKENLEKAKEALDKAKENAAKAEANKKALEKALQNANLSKEQREALEKALKDAAQAAQNAQEQMSDAQQSFDKAMEQMKLSEEAMKGLEELMKDPALQKLREMAAKLQKRAQDAKSGKVKKMTRQEREEMLKQMEEFAKQLKDPEFRKAFLKALEEALKNGQLGEGAGGFGLSLGLGLGMPGGPGGDDRMTFDTKHVNKSEKPIEGKGKGTPSYVQTERGEGDGDETFVEIKGPTTLGSQTSIPFANQIPVYKDKAESAIKSGEIPKKHRNRVRDYFGGLVGAPKSKK